MRHLVFIVILATICSLLAKPLMVQAAPHYLGLPKEMKICETADADKSIVCGTLTWQPDGRYKSLLDDGRFGYLDISSSPSGSKCTIGGPIKDYTQPRDLHSVYYSNTGTDGFLSGTWDGKQVIGEGYVTHYDGGVTSQIKFRVKATPLSPEQTVRETLSGGSGTPACLVAASSATSVQKSAPPQVAASTARPISQTAAQSMLAQQLAQMVASHQITPEQAKITLDAAKQAGGLTVSGSGSSLQIDLAPPSATPGPGQFIDPNFAWPKGEYNGNFLQWRYKGNAICVFARDMNGGSYLGYDDKGAYIWSSEGGVSIWNGKTHTLAGYSSPEAGPDGITIKKPDPRSLNTKGVPPANENCS